MIGGSTRRATFAGTLIFKVPAGRSRNAINDIHRGFELAEGRRQPLQ